MASFTFSKKWEGLTATVSSASISGLAGLGRWDVGFSGELPHMTWRKNAEKQRVIFLPFCWRVQHIYVTYICFIFGTKEWKDHIHLLFLHVFFVSMFFRGKIHRKGLPVLVRPLRCLHREDFENFEGHPVGWGTLAWGDGWMIGWMLGVIFWQGMEHGMFFLINFFLGGRGGTRLKVGVLFFGVFDVCMFFLCIILKISELILWSWDCSDFKSCLYSERTSWCPNCFLLTLWKTKLKPCGSHSFWFHGCKSLCIPWCCFKKHSSLSPNWTEKNSK